MDIKEKIKNLPASPGVYLMKDSLDSVIYVGKSKNLRNRVGSYFQNSKSHPPKVVKLVKNLKDFDYIVTDTEFEAFMLECKLIKEIKPIYNKQMKSPKSYSYIRIRINEKYPDIEISNEIIKDDGNLYFGPYTNKSTVERGLQGIKEYFKILCSSSSRKTSACLNYSLGLCIGICLGDSQKEQYLKIIHDIIKLFNATDKSIIKAMEYKMNALSENLDFENAAKYRDYITAVKYLYNKAKVVRYTKRNKNIVLLEPLDDHRIKFFLIRGNKVLFSEKYSLTDFDAKQLKLILKNNILSYFGNKTYTNTIEIGREEIDETQIIYTYLKNNANNCKHIIIPENCLNSQNNTNIESALSTLLG